MMTRPKFFLIVTVCNSLILWLSLSCVQLVHLLRVMTRMYVIGHYVMTALDICITEGLTNMWSKQQQFSISVLYKKKFARVIAIVLLTLHDQIIVLNIFVLLNPKRLTLLCLIYKFMRSICILRTYLQL